MDNNNGIVVGIGEVLWDMLPEGKRLGGAPANFAYHASQMGLHACVASAVGNDALGTLTLEQLKAKGLDCDYIARNGLPTGTVQVELDAKGVPSYYITQNVAWDDIQFTPQLAELAQRAQVVCYGSLAQRSEASRNAIYSFIDAIPHNGNVLKVCDINLRAPFFTREVICESVQRCNVLKINDDELLAISQMFGYGNIGMKDKCWLLLGKYNLKMLVLTCGVNGSYVFTPGDISFLAAPKVTVADTIGAGDSFTGAFVASVLKGESVAQAHRRAVEVSAYVCTQAGGMPSIPQQLKS